MARNFSWILPYKFPPMVDRGGLLLGLGVRTMRELEQFLNTEAEWVLERLSTGTEANDRNYYQGRVDQLAQVRRFLQLPQLMFEREKADK